MPKKFPPDFKRDVVAVARRGDLTVEVAADFDISPESVRRWMRQADIDAGIRDGRTTAEQAEWCGCAGKTAGSRWRTRSCAARPAAYFAKDALPK